MLDYRESIRQTRLRPSYRVDGTSVILRANQIKRETAFG
jgi:hypothetical protein